MGHPLLIGPRQGATADPSITTPELKFVRGPVSQDDTLSGEWMLTISFVPPGRYLRFEAVYRGEGGTQGTNISGMRLL